MKPVIEFRNYKITKINYRSADNISELDPFKENDRKISLSVGLTEEKDNARLIVATTIIDEENLRVAEIEVTGYFDINPEVSEEDIEGYLVQNGTAILFPYMRATVSFITSLDNEKAVILPTINTTNFNDGGEE